MRGIFAGWKKSILDSPRIIALQVGKEMVICDKRHRYMFLRWMVRSDESGVDFGLWKNIPASALMLPLDVHTGDVARALGLLTRTQNDWKAVEEITAVLRNFDSLGLLS